VQNAFNGKFPVNRSGSAHLHNTYCHLLNVTAVMDVTDCLVLLICIVFVSIHHID